LRRTAGTLLIKILAATHFGYKLHASVDKRYKLNLKLAVTRAAVANTTVFEDLLDPTDTSRDFAGSLDHAYDGSDGHGARDGRLYGFDDVSRNWHCVYLKRS
jgi:IS5 family transposase